MGQMEHARDTSWEKRAHVNLATILRMRHLVKRYLVISAFSFNVNTFTYKMTNNETSWEQYTSFLLFKVLDESLLIPISLQTALRRKVNKLENRVKPFKSHSTTRERRNLG